ncbi:hypothetical protein BDK51DRAFT_34585 [Blyttiomyces helicus]|uniref:Uncharacterized protein n=1 Tax=Blyttiomyces helicus TaxID=388810 RepID=A0A4P9VZ98_9FUNG|nr:hypothetical protein BDK51DRAFT_34585 [Blyttiomyces helicus]|eukprot:RKO84103.1 hypothetical protein BDK51DRAFT_34585 [Blyttiomyces helicus]
MSSTFNPIGAIRQTFSSRNGPTQISRAQPVWRPETPTTRSWGSASIIFLTGAIFGHLGRERGECGNDGLASVVCKERPHDRERRGAEKLEGTVLAQEGESGIVDLVIGEVELVEERTREGRIASSDPVPDKFQRNKQRACLTDRSKTLECENSRAAPFDLDLERAQVRAPQGCERSGATPQMEVGKWQWRTSKPNLRVPFMDSMKLLMSSLRLGTEKRRLGFSYSVWDAAPNHALETNMNL